MPDLSTFGARLALVRQRMGWTNIKEAAEACAIAPQTWRQWESGKFEPRQLVNACMKVSGVTGVDYRWLALGPAVSQGELAPAATAKPTGEYSMRQVLGERVIAVGAGQARDDVSNMRSNLRTRPIDGVRLDRTAVR